MTREEEDRAAEYQATREDSRKLFTNLQGRIIRCVNEQLPILSKDTRDALGIKVTNEVREYLSEAFS